MRKMLVWWDGVDTYMHVNVRVYGISSEELLTEIRQG